MCEHSVIFVQYAVYLHKSYADLGVKFHVHAGYPNKTVGFFFMTAISSTVGWLLETGYRHRDKPADRLEQTFW